MRREMAIEELQSGRYHYKRLLGSGGMGDVYLMQDTRVSRQVAIKIMRAESALTARDGKVVDAARLFQREAKAIAALEHPNILPLYDFGEETRNGTTITYMVMPYCTAGSLEHWLRTQSEQPFSPPEVAYLIEQAAEALQYAHEHEVIHLDVKPSNFLLRNNRKKPRRPTLLLADFGIARNFTTVASSSRTIRGTPTSMAPEQWSGSPVFASDQYALAVMAYELLTGRPPFTGSMEQLMYRHFTAPAPAPSTFNPRLPAALDPVLLRALAKQPEDRFPSIADFASAFTEAAQQPATPFEPPVEEDVTEYATLAISEEAADAGISRLLTLADGQEEIALVPLVETDEDQPLAFSSEDETSVQLNHTPKQVEEVSTEEEARVEHSPETPPIDQHAPGEASSEPELQALAEPSLEDEQLHSPIELASERELHAPAVADAGYDLPTLMANGSGVQVTEAPLSAPARKVTRRTGVLALVSVLAVLLLVVGTISMVLNHQSANGQNRAHQSTSAATSKTTTTPTAIATPAPGLYIAGTYNGSMSNNAGQQTAHLSVSLMQTQGQGALRGTMMFNGSTQQTYQLSGKVDLQGNYSFTVQQPAGQVPYVFYGGLVQNSQGVYLRGNYCNSSTGTCQASIGYFYVGPKE